MLPQPRKIHEPEIDEFDVLLFAKLQDICWRH
jgi:hypothetical protein